MEAEIPDVILEQIFWSLKGTDLKKCRLVCNRWNNLVSWNFHHKTCFSFNGHGQNAKLIQTSWKNYFLPNYIHNIKLAKLLTKYLIPQEESILKTELSQTQQKQLYDFSNNTSIIKPWPNLRFRKTSNQQFKCLIKTWKSIIAASSRNQTLTSTCQALKLQEILTTVTKLELCQCKIKLTNFLKFLQFFPNLHTLVDDNTYQIYYLWNEIVCPDESVDPNIYTPEDTLVLRKCANLAFPSIKSIRLKKSTPFYNTMSTILLWEHTIPELEELSLQLYEEDLYPLISRDWTERLALLLLKHCTTLKKLVLNWWHNCYDSYFEDCLRVVHILNTNATSPFVITEISLTVQWIFINREDFQQIFIPFIKGLPFLKKLHLAKIMFEATRHIIRTLKELRPNELQEEEVESIFSTAACSRNLSDFEFTFVLFLCDLLNEDRMATPSAATSYATSNYIPNQRRQLQNHQSLKKTRDILKHDIFKTCMTALHVAFDQAFLTSLHNLLPFVPNTEQFESVTELNLTSSRNSTYSKLFTNFQIELIPLTFPNLTTLAIFDGPHFTYSKKPIQQLENQYDNMSNAIIGNADMQVILGHLTKLKSLKLRVNFSKLTDSGLTGLNEETCAEMRCKDLSLHTCIPDDAKVGASFSNVQGLTEIMLKGLPDSITKVTAFFAFNDCVNLKILNLCGEFQFKKEGKEFLEQKAHKSGVEIQLNIP